MGSVTAYATSRQHTAVGWFSLVAASVLACGPALAATVSSDAFSFTGGSPALASGPGAGAIFAYWDPRLSAANPHVHDPGFHISFFGTGQGCAEGALNGPVGPLDAAQARQLVAPGTAFSPASGARVWSPLPDAAQCGAAPHRAGPAFLAASGSGVPMQLFTAVEQPGSGAFWGPFGVRGQVGKGTNAASDGTFLNWALDWQHGHGIQPWADGNASHDITVSTDEAVPATMVQYRPAGVRPSQAHQKFELGFYNTACLAAVSNKILCQLRVMFDVALVRQQGTDWSRLKFAQQAHLLFDRAQGGLPIIEGPLEQNGELTYLGRSGAAVWRSTGAPTQHGPFQMQHFGATFNFKQLLETLHAVAAHEQRQNASSDGADMPSMFGPRWNDPAAWTIGLVTIGQEVHVGDRATAAYIGGEVASLTVGR
jgi:hypothetical protein